ncbi:phage tail protein [Sorangium sp. So ce128]|uniref:phage tail protein n=1 Tax=Sorangium sp. So ce128 TaxID=3133281 RepID=UPI003F62F5F8
MSEETPKKKPFAFEITYDLFTPSGERLRNVLLRENPGASQPLMLQIVNILVQEEETITLRKEPKPSKSKYHFKLRFAPGILDDRTIDVVGGDWSVLRDDTGDGAYLYVAWVSEDVAIGPSAHLTLALQGVSPTPEAGAEVTLDLSWKTPVTDPLYRGPMGIIAPAGKPPSEYELDAKLELGVRSRVGNPHSPLRAGFVGDNRVLNVNNQESSLLFRLANAAREGLTGGAVRFHYDANEPGLSSKLVVALPVGPTDTHPWALGTADQVKDVLPGDLDGFARSGPEPSADGTLLEWTFTPTREGVELAPQAFLELSLSKLVTSHPDGPTHLVLRYSAVPDYWDGEIVCPIEKAPLVFGRRVDADHDHRGNVGIRRGLPGTGLSLDGDLLLHSKEVQNVGTLVFRSDVDGSSEDVAAQFFKKGETDALLALTSKGDLHPAGKLSLKSPHAEQAPAAVIEADNRASSGDLGLRIRTQKGGSLQDSALITPEGRVKDKTGFLVPVGTIVAYAGAEAPEGWLLCHGQTVSRTTYPELFAAIGTTYDPSNTTDFTVPNLQTRVPVGASADYSVGATGGAATVTLTEAQMPSHTHGVDDPGHQHDITAYQDKDPDKHWGPYFSCLTNKKTPVTETATTGISIIRTGGGQPHNNMQPYLVLNYIIKH